MRIYTRRTPECHPDRKHRGHGFCAQCYRGMVKVRLKLTSASCHPDRPIRAKGLCDACYNHQWRRTTARKGDRETYDGAWNDRKREEHPWYFREMKMRVRYRIYFTKKMYEAMYAEQEGRCLICDEWQPVLDVDHCHEANVIRGLLCGHCNRGIGLFRENPERLRRAAEYCVRFQPLKQKTKEAA